MEPSCKCRKPPFYFGDFERIEIGEDAFGAEVSLNTCKACGLVWLNYLIEEPQFSRSGRWWRVPLPPEQSDRLSANAARQFLEQQPWCFVGGSFFESTGHEVLGPIKVR